MFPLDDNFVFGDIFFFGWYFFLAKAKKKYSAKKKKYSPTNEVTHPTETPLCLWYFFFMPPRLKIFGVTTKPLSKFFRGYNNKFVFKKHGCTRVILTRSKHGEFKKLFISRNLLEIELNGVHFWRLCFFELFAAEIRFLHLWTFRGWNPIFTLFELHTINFPLFSSK